MPSATAKHKILLVDDDAFVLDVMRQQLTQLGVTDVVAYQQADGAVDALKADLEAFDLVFCDLQMPGMDGIQFIRELAGIQYKGALVLVSGENTRILQTAKRLAQAQDLDILGTLDKPTSIKQLSEILQAPANPREFGKSRDTRISASELEHAIESGQLVNHYQPKVAFQDGALVGVEALARWQHPTAGWIFPDRFIPVAEANGLMDQLTQTVLTTALGDTRKWLTRGLDLHVAINVSMQCLSDLSFADRLFDSAQHFGAPLERLIIEVTETFLLDDRVAPADILTRLRLRKVGVSIDDFGTGHSTLTKLRDIPFNELKIDRGFVHGASRDPELGSIVRASLRLAKQLGIRTVAEGVEDADDWNFLLDAGCDLAQGYFIARPMPAGQLPAWLHEWNARPANSI
ncbi:MAG TPA: EAL domain-containing response regulator [Gammaproteobacteria bacterium]|nr:EAL domain-containing response regulator [Gammaproteobacteria bacterium]